MNSYPFTQSLVRNKFGINYTGNYCFSVEEGYTYMTFSNGFLIAMFKPSKIQKPKFEPAY
jgi:hypothetical protein